MLKDVSVFIGNPQDVAGNVVVTQGGVTTNYSDTTVQDLVNNNDTIFKFVENPTGQTDLGFQIDDTVSCTQCNFNEYGTGAPYSLPTVDYTGPRPTIRRPTCA